MFVKNESACSGEIILLIYFVTCLSFLIKKYQCDYFLERVATDMDEVWMCLTVLFKATQGHVYFIVITFDVTYCVMVLNRCNKFK